MVHQLNTKCLLYLFLTLVLSVTAADTDVCIDTTNPIKCDTKTKCGWLDTFQYQDDSSWNKLIYVKDDLGKWMNRNGDDRAAVPFVHSAAHTIVMASCNPGSYQDGYGFHDYEYTNNGAQFAFQRQCGDNTRYFMALVNNDNAAAQSATCLQQNGVPVLNDTNKLPYLKLSSIISHCNQHKAENPVMGSVIIVTQCDATSFGGMFHLICMVIAFLILQPIAFMLMESYNNVKKVLVLYIAMGCFLLIGFVAGATAPELNRGLRYEAIVWLVSLASGAVGVASIFLPMCIDRFPKMNGCNGCCKCIDVFRIVHRIVAIIVGPIVVILLCYRLAGICEGGEYLFIMENGNQCPGHFLVGLVMNAWGVLVFLTEIKGKEKNEGYKTMDYI